MANASSISSVAANTAAPMAAIAGVRVLVIVAPNFFARLSESFSALSKSFLSCLLISGKFEYRCADYVCAAKSTHSHCELPPTPRPAIIFSKPFFDWAAFVSPPA